MLKQEQEFTDAPREILGEEKSARSTPGRAAIRFYEELEFRASGFQVLGSRVLGFSGLGVQDF